MTWALDTAARTMAMECRGEILEGQIAIAWVLRTRMESARWGHTLASVCLWNAHIHGGGQVFQFSGWAGNDPNFAYACGLTDDDPMVEHMLEVLTEVMAADPATDPTHQATHYCNLDVVTPAWIQGATQTAKIGHHTFFKNVK